MSRPNPIMIYEKTLNEKIKWAYHNGLMLGFWNGLLVGILIVSTLFWWRELG